MEIFKLINESPVIESFEVLDYKKWQSGRYFRLKIILNNETELFVREYLDESERDYSFHWQSADGKLIIRWDNARHHKHIKTYPNHKHVGETVEESLEMSLDEILSHIEKYEK